MTKSELQLELDEFRDLLNDQISQNDILELENDRMSRELKNVSEAYNTFKLQVLEKLDSSQESVDKLIDILCKVTDAR